MPTVKTPMDERTYERLVAMRKKAGLPSVSALFLKNCGVLDDRAEATEIARRALVLAKRKPRGVEYRLRDLFLQKTWEKFSKGARLRAGRIFFEQVASAVHGVRATRKSSTNHQFYETAARAAQQ